ncbi:cation/H(+) antiporter 15-like isoform X1 [Triticum dicoccoides]|uniref:cation/H(+) antiporter 15-like isoform X1 n=1 Tax=Triticum dicoccoides TaxID=85692 RepID=UPI001890BC29|nr:cation/H(+) antiporter 15-like isoform X1 [Triticum dicoccoides]
MESGVECADVVHGDYFMGGMMVINGLMAVVLLLSGLFHSFLRRLGQPSIISHILAGVVVGPTFLGRAVDLRRLGMQNAGSALGDTIYYLRIIFMFFLGLEMDLRYLRHNLRRSLLLACGGSAISFLLAVAAGPFFYGMLHPSSAATFHPQKLYASTALFILVLTSTASPVLIRIVTELKLTTSETGQLAIGAAFATDIASLTAISMMVVNPTIFGHDGKPLPSRSSSTSCSTQLILFLWMALVVCVAVGVAVRAARLMNRMRRGRQYVSKYELLGMLLLIVGLSLAVQFMGYSASMAAFLIGLAVPREGPLARTLVDRLTYPVHQMVMPLCFGAIGARLDFAEIGRFTATQFAFAVAFTTAVSSAGKVGGTVLVGRWLGMSAREALVLGFLLNVKGYSDILAINLADKSNVWGDTAQVVLVVASILNTFMAGPASAAIVRQQRRAFKYRSHCLQELRVEQELRVLVCVHGAGGVQAMLTLAELSKGSSAPVAVYLLHLVELQTARKYAITHLYNQSLSKEEEEEEEEEDARWGYSWEMEQVTAAVHGFTTYDYDAAVPVPVRQMTAISSLASMDADVRNGVEDARASLVIVPFHKEQRYDGRMVSRRGGDGRRQLNQRILQRARCTVGILVERRLPGIPPSISAAPTPMPERDDDLEALQQGEEEAMQQVVAVFLSGADDREAVAYATRLSAHPWVSVSVSRFMLPEESRRRMGMSMSEEEAEDEEFMAEVRARFVSPGQVTYTERYVSNGVETLESLSSMVGECSLFVVGRGGGEGGGGAARNTMTRGMAGLEVEEEECPELGAVGEVLASDDFLGCCSCASVLVLQQHKLHRRMRTWKKQKHKQHSQSQSLPFFPDAAADDDDIFDCDWNYD